MSLIVKKINVKKLTLLMLLQFLVFGITYGKQIPTVTGILKTDPTYMPNVTIGMTSAINTIAVPVVAGTKDYKIQNTVALKYELNTDTFFLSQTDVRVEVQIDRFDASGSSLPTINTNLLVSINNKLNTPILEESVVNLEDGYSITMTITKIWVNGMPVSTLPKYVSVESEINIDRYYDFSSPGNTIPSNIQIIGTDRDCDATIDELEVSWTVPTSLPEEYQLEWYYVSNYSPSGSNYPASAFVTDFKNNSTRITTVENSYKVSVIYPDGYIVFRVRAVGRDYLNPSQFIFGRWNLPDEINIGTLSSPYFYTINGHEEIKNWQYSSTYAEEGKRKEVISYFDGSLRNRQSVTKINSDKNVIIGETIYDYQGRPAVNILPVPVDFNCVTTGAEPSIRYYNKFNVDDTNKVYSKNDFDLDAGELCLSVAAPMDTVSGASLYYSNSNPNKNSQQAYLPHAKEYPFTQIEYTPDNTGRIRNQSGLGPDYQLGSGRETKYLYGQPNQIQVDRLFGSETGDASQYKKNVVIDANGQTSVTYMNQEGKTIATALAGNPPTIGLTSITRLDSLDYAAQNQAQLTIDMFNKNTFGYSQLNHIPPSGDQLNFSTQLLVTFKSSYDFSYNLDVDTLGDVCLRSNICISCVYDMEIHVVDECGLDMVTTVSPYEPIKRVTGNVDTTGNKLTFNTNCISPTLFKDSAKVSLILDPGVYTVSKILKVNQQAKDYYVKKYTDSVYNSCVMTLSQFQAAKLALVDTMDCYNTCASCVTALGTRDDFVSLGNGTAEQWDILVALCNEPCRVKSLCEVTYEMLLSDVSPGGQYGKFNTTTFDASTEPISVFNTGNILNPNTIPLQQAHWKTPLMRSNGNVLNMYLDENGIRTKVYVAEITPGVFLPPVDNTSLVYVDNVANLQYTYPENLQNLSDFISNWNSNYARSLVVFHPEYAYYVSCIDQSLTFPGDTHSSEAIDSMLFATESFAQAVSVGLINSNYLTSTPAINKIKDIWITPTGNYDPFFTNTTFQYSTVFNPVTGAQTATNMTGSASYNVNLQTEMDDIVNNYLTVGLTQYSMVDVAAIMTRCGNNFGTTTPAATCLDFGKDYYVSPPYAGANDTIRNKEWRVYRQLYFAEKQKLQFKRMNFYAKYCNDAYSNYYGGCNACIGNSGYEVFKAGMVTLDGSGFPDTDSPYFDTSQPCGVTSSSNYPGVLKRFINPANTGLKPEEASLQLYQTTGQCQIAFELQFFLNALASNGSFVGGYDLKNFTEFTPNLQVAINGGIPPSSYTHLYWSSSVFGGALYGGILDSNSVAKCFITIHKPVAISSYSDIIGINQLVYDPQSANFGGFTANALYISGSDTLSAFITGESSCLELNCSFDLKCQGNQFAHDMSNIFSYLQSSGLLDNTSAVPISSNPTLNLFLTPSIKSTLGTPNSNIEYKFTTPNQLEIYDSSNPSTEIIFTYIVTPSAAATSIKTFANIKSNFTNLYAMDALDVNGIKIADISGTANKITSSQTFTLSIGDCDVPAPIECSEIEYQVTKDIEALVNEILTTEPFNSNFNLYNLTRFSPLLKTYISPTVTATGSTYTSGLTSTPNFDTLTISLTTSPLNNYSSCDFKLYHYRNNSTILNFEDIVSVTELSGIGTPDIAGNYFHFKALATYVVGMNPPVTDTIYGFSCWPIKNCMSCGILVNTYTYSTAFDRSSGVPYNGSNNGNYDPYWTVIKTQNLTYPPIVLTGSPTYLGPVPNAFDVSTNLPALLPFSSGYINIDNGHTSTVKRLVTYSTNFTMPNPSLSNSSFSLIINARADDGIYRISVNGVDLYTSLGGNAYSGTPASVGVDSETSSLLISGVNSIEIDAVDLGVDHFEMAAQVFLNEYNGLCRIVPPDTIFVFPPYTKYDNPCVKQKINLALQNAANSYNQYINDLATVFADKYTKHCLGALEKFTYKYIDKEYHHTLYYYDQAGNLIKTVPPEGVEYLPITSNKDALEQKIISDRTTGEQNVFTTHRMATKYVYNSLNQLIFQTLPDHDNISSCNGLNPNGLDTSLVINAIQFVTPSKGYLCGEIKKTGTFNRGYVYTTNDAGNSWVLLNGVTAGDLQKVQYVTSTLGYAVSNFGIVFKTIDGGNHWDLLTGLYNPVSGSRYVDVLNDLCFISSSFGVFGGIKQGSGSPIFYTNDGGNTYYSASVTGASVGDTITSFAYDGTTYIASAKNGIQGKQFISTNGTSWSLVNFSANNLKRVQFISTSLAYAIGEEGTLLKLAQPISGTPIFQLVPTGMLGSFVDVYFKNATDGIAIIDSVSGLGQIFKTFDGGLTWDQLSANGDYYNSLQLYDAANDKLIAAGRNGIVARVLLTSAPFGIIKITTPNSAKQIFADAHDNGTNGVIAIAVSDAPSTDVLSSYDVQSANPTWEVSSTAPNIVGPDTRFKKVLLLDSSSATPWIKGVILSSTGKLFSFFRRYEHSMSFQAVTIPGGAPGKFFTDITTNSQAFSSTIYAFDTISKRNYKINFSGSIASAVVIANLSPISRNITAIDINNSGNEFLIVGDNGHIQFSSDILAPNTIWDDISLMTLPVAINNVKSVTTNTFIATGIDGAVWKNYGSASDWYLVKSATVEKLNAVAVDNTGSGLVAANNGNLYQLKNALTAFPVLLPILTGLTSNLKDVAIEPGGTSAYAIAANGQVLYMNNYSSPTPVLAAPASPSAVNGVAFKNGPNATVVGDNALVTNYFGINAMTTKDLFTKGLISIHFYDANNGYTIDSSDVIRKTSNGGISWSVILPIQGSELTKVHATQSSGGVLVGLNKFAASITGVTLSNLTIPGTIPGGTHFYDINYNSTKSYGFIVGSNTRAAKIVGNSITDLGQQGSSLDFRAVHVFDNNSFIASGVNGIIYYHKNSVFTRQMNYAAPAGLSQSDIILKDIYFNDYYSGYVVGDNGASYKVDLNDSIGTKGPTASSLQWQPFCSDGIYMAYSTNPEIENLDFRSIACPNKINIMIGGGNANISIGGYSPNRYARLLKDQSGYYSTRFWYDKLGRLTVSQNTKQFNKTNPADPGVQQAFSYTLYDPLGRILEVGEKFENHIGGSPKMNSIFGSFVNGYYNNNTIDDTKLQAWINDAGERREVTKTYYDEQFVFLYGTQYNLRKRVASSTYEEIFDGADETYSHATHYSYDIHGNVKTVWQENTQVGVGGEEVKQIDYEYDLISSKVNKVIYSPLQVDQFIHRYTYDADNRITKVETSKNDLHYDLEAKYFYYAHGPLARVEYGKNQVQGMDYAYTLQGWIKGVNSNTLKKAKDIGSDGDRSFANPNGNFGRDIVGYSLNYYADDYEAIDFTKWNTASTRFEAYKSGSDLSASSNDLFNGNISSMVTSISQIDTNASGVVLGATAYPLGNGYRYDQLNRIKLSSSFTNIDTGNNEWLNDGSTIPMLYRNKFSYDANGNIKTQVKRDSVGNLIDSLIYNYEEISSKLRRNRLYHVNDLASVTPPGDSDIKDQGTFTSGASINLSNNYSFDEIGNLIKDNAEDIDTIRWSVYGKIRAIVRSGASSKDNLFFDYDASGNRIAKHVYTSGNIWKNTTYYLRDAQGNVMSVYDKNIISHTMHYKLKEQHLYGSSRLGISKLDFEMIDATSPEDILVDTTKSYLGYKHYELSNHLGNVLTVISDKKIAVEDPDLPNIIDHYVADMISATDYYAFGSPMPGRQFNNGSYRYGFNGKENDNEVKGTGNSVDYGARIYDTRLGKTLSIDPHDASYPWASPYSMFANNPLIYIDQDGKDIIVYDHKGVGHTFKPGEKGPAGNVQVQKAFAVLNELYTNTATDANGGVSPKGIMDNFISDTKHDWKITQFAQKDDGSKMGTTNFKTDVDAKNFTSATNTTYNKLPDQDPEDAFTKFNPDLVPFMQKDDGTVYEASPVVILAHELSHANDQIYNYPQYAQEKKDGSNASHQRAIVLQNKVAETKGEKQRDQSDKTLGVSDTKEKPKKK